MRFVCGLVFLFVIMNTAYALRPGFVYLHDVDPTILQDMRYMGFHNFIGRPIKGYEAKRCILTEKAALALSEVQKELEKNALSLKVYDCYRPTMAVQDFLTWSKDPKNQKMKSEFYPRVDKADVFRLAYVAEKSGHSRGSTMDLTIVALPIQPQAHFHPGQELIACTAPYKQRYHDNSLDMGTGFDCLDELSHALNQDISPLAMKHRMRLRQVMLKHGFLPYENEWWHFTLKDEAYPNTYFNFHVK